MKSSIFLRTCQRDIKWAEWCLKSIGKYWKTKSQIVVSADLQCKPAIQSCQQFVGPIKFVPQEQWDPGWNFQQYVKMNCEAICDGEFITFIDSDCVFTSECSLDDLCENGHPVIWLTEYAKIPEPRWKGNIERLMKTYVEYDFMRRFPITYRRDSIAPCRRHLEGMHNVSLEKILRELPSHVFSEFNILGCYAFHQEFNRYSWKHTDEIDLHPEKYQWHVPVRQFNWFEWNEETPDMLAKLTGISQTSLGEMGRVVKTPELGQKALSEVITSFLNPGDLVIDVGAHEGYHVKACAAKGCEVHSFEPNPMSFMKLWQVHDKLDKGKCYPYAVSDKQGAVDFQLDLECSEASFIPEKASPETISVPCVTIDQMFKDGVRLIKVDVEGYEFNVLRGALNLIRASRPVIIVECQKDTLERAGHNKEDIEGFLRSEGYKWEISITDPRASKNEDDYFYDLICQPI